MTTSDFFAMFDAPFQYGGGWTAADDESRTQVVVIADFLNDKLFGGANSVGRIIPHQRSRSAHRRRAEALGAATALLRAGLGGRSYGDGDAVFLPLQTARAAKMGPQNECYAVADTSKLETAPCIWLGFWVELQRCGGCQPTRQFLSNYAQQQIALGRFQRPETVVAGSDGLAAQRAGGA
jgi:putative ABC transport system permease protein